MNLIYLKKELTLPGCWTSPYVTIPIIVIAFQTISAKHVKSRLFHHCDWSLPEIALCLQHQG